MIAEGTLTDEGSSSRRGRREKIRPRGADSEATATIDLASQPVELLRKPVMANSNSYGEGKSFVKFQMVVSSRHIGNDGGQGTPCFDSSLDQGRREKRLLNLRLNI